MSDTRRAYEEAKTTNNPKLYVDALLGYFGRPVPLDVLEDAAYNPRHDLDHVGLEIKKTLRRRYVAIARNPDTPPLTLVDLHAWAWEGSDNGLLADVYENPNCPDYVREQGMTHEDYMVRSGVADSKYAAKQWPRLAVDLEPYVRSRLARNYHIPIILVEQLQADEDKMVRWFANGNMNKRTDT